jgi:hypothetical protein
MKFLNKKCFITSSLLNQRISRTTVQSNTLLNTMLFTWSNRSVLTSLVNSTFKVLELNKVSINVSSMQHSSSQSLANSCNAFPRNSLSLRM